MAHQFNQKQQEIFNRLKKFVQKEDEHDTFILSGYAGTGKTFLMQHFAQWLQSERRKFALLATTGRAAAVLRGKTNFQTKTIHGKLYTFSKVDGDHEDLTAESSVDDFGQMKLLFKPVKNLESECVYIVDEASMLATESKDETSFAKFGSGNLLSDLLTHVGGDKIIFVGDPAQLPPVFQEKSRALDKNYLNSLGRKTIERTLSQIMRTRDDNDIIQLSTEVRKAIGKTPDVDWIKLPARRYNNCEIVPDKNSLFLEYYARFLQYGPKKCIGIAHSNKACNHLNDYFRRRLFPNPRKLLEKGEILMVTQNNYLVPLTNGDFVKVLRFGEKSSKAGLRFQNITIQHLETEKEYEIKIALEPLASFAPNLSLDQQRNLMIDFSKRMKKSKITPNSLAYKEAMQKDAFLNSLRATYGYVVTCHKSQGGEWNDIFLFLDSGMYGYMTKTYMRRWWYTAVTRTKEQLYLHDDWWLQ